MTSDGQYPAIFTLPMLVREACVLDKFVATFESGRASSLGMTGRVTSGDRILLVAYETQIEEWSLATLSRNAIDQLVFGRFAEALERKTGRRQFSSVGPGSDPPDLAVTGADGPVGLELTQLADASRREGASRLNVVRRRLSERKAHFPALEGWNIFVWTEDLVAPDFLRGGADDIVNMLAGLNPTDHLVFLDANQDLPNPLRMPELPQTSGGIHILATPPGMTPSTTRFASQHGFELGLAHSSWIARPEALAKLHDSIAAKDRPGNDALLITFGAFDHTGFRWPAESLVFGLLTGEDLPSVEARHLRTVYLHDWSGSVAEVPLSLATL